MVTVEPHRAAVLLLHAFPVDARVWAPVAERLAARGYRVVVPDLPGFGSTPVPPSEASVEVMAQQVLGELDRLDIDRVAVAGLSMGGYVLMALLRIAPHRISAIALVDTKMTADAETARETRLEVAARAEREGTADFLVEAMIGNLVGPATRSRQPAVVAEVTQMIRQATPAGVAWAQRAMAGRPDSQGVLSAFDGVGVVVVGADDVISPVDEQAQMAAILADGELIVIPEAGHLSPIENPVAVAAALSDWLGRSGPSVTE